MIPQDLNVLSFDPNQTVCIPKEIWIAQSGAIVNAIVPAELIFMGIGLGIGIVVSYLYFRCWLNIQETG